MQTEPSRIVKSCVYAMLCNSTRESSTTNVSSCTGILADCGLQTRAQEAAIKVNVKRNQNTSCKFQHQEHTKKTPICRVLYFSLPTICQSIQLLIVERLCLLRSNVKRTKEITKYSDELAR